ncbi:MAG: ABC transporter ATP-binding protein, partial [Pseudomonadota bacterium]
QNTNVALRFAHHGYILESGRVVMEGRAEELRENPDVREFYLGMSEKGRRSFRDARSYRRRKRWLS